MKKHIKSTFPFTHYANTELPWLRGKKTKKSHIYSSLNRLHPQFSNTQSLQLFMGQQSNYVPTEMSHSFFSPEREGETSSLQPRSSCKATLQKPLMVMTAMQPPTPSHHPASRTRGRHWVTTGSLLPTLPALHQAETFCALDVLPDG